MKGSTCHFFQQLSEPRAEEEEEGKLLTQALEFKLPEAWVGFDFWLLLAEGVYKYPDLNYHWVPIFLGSVY